MNKNLKKNDAVVISLPFSDTGSKHFLMDKIIFCSYENLQRIQQKNLDIS